MHLLYVIGVKSLETECVSSEMEMAIVRNTGAKTALSNLAKIARNGDPPVICQNPHVYRFSDQDIDVLDVLKFQKLKV